MASSLLSGIYSGISNTYSYIAAQYDDGLTLENLNNARTNTKLATTINQSFASYLQTNFSNLDKDNDGVISAEEMTNMTNTLSKTGLTKAELTQLYASGASGISDSKMTEILEHFDEIDSNGDGKITDAEISAFTVDSAKQEKMDEFRMKSASNMSTFYGSDSSDTSDTYSILSYKYKSSSSS
ncbi:MAG: hypothetical protein BHW55_02550 [Candidatus Melainabacteria bacterium 35_41]|jgi:hypothetical protein|nr:MAG: hypothetical protein BHW55_02550 [Candidatus Melainabacteria bacterium 35_41]